ncbi:hypothetical protein SeLEV6574_g01480 [Synchytrium endobioticum]|uniref:FYVE-type domain-containing protein n=1 Tax=Synchytrium endobioticum TaxID=286115 RepID=A0A507DEZ1_9FUNG|nr:hypothetical protein SeLEV6574_g01480 [Synchytrium endobioticum]
MDGGQLKPKDLYSICSCGQAFNIFYRRKYHCHYCLNVLCLDCLGNGTAMLDQTLGPVPVCKRCLSFLDMQSLSESELVAKPTSELRSYLDTYGIRAPSGALEKKDLARIVMNTPIDGARLAEYRRVAPSGPLEGRWGNGPNPLNSNPQHNNPLADLFPQFFQQFAPPTPASTTNPSTRPRRNSDPAARTTMPSTPYTHANPNASSSSSGASPTRASSSSNAAPPRQKQSSRGEAPSVKQIVKENMDVSQFGAGMLKLILRNARVDHLGVVEKDELITRVRRLVDNVKTEMEQVAFGSEDGLCTVCCEDVVNCVFLECGHLESDR